MSEFLLFSGLALSVLTWVVGLRPYLSRLGKQTSGASFFQGMSNDVSQANELAKQGDSKARMLARIVRFGLILATLGFLAIVYKSFS